MRNAVGFSYLCRKMGETPPGAPEGGMPRPDIVIANTTVCDVRQKFTQAARRYWKDVAIFDYDIPWPSQGADLESVQGYYFEYFAAEVRRFVAFLEGLTGKRLDNDKLFHYMRIQYEAAKIYDEIYKLRQAVPTPVGVRDMLTVYPAEGFFNCEEETLDLLTRVRDEIKERVDQKIAAIPNERYRLMYSLAPPPWYALPLFSYLESLGAAFVVEYSIFPDPDPPPYVELNDPIDTLAWRQWQRFSNPRCCSPCYFPNFPKVIANWVEGSKVDGFVIWAIPACRLNLGNIYYRDHAEQILGRKIPTIVLELDQVDPRSYSEAEVRAKLDAFIEVLASSKR